MIILLLHHCHAFPIKAQEPSFRITRGLSIDIKQCPYFVLVLKDNGFLHCGGTILNTNRVLTAGHCLVNQAKLSVLAGYNPEYKGMQVTSVEHKLIHPMFREQYGNETTPSIIEYDVGILVLAHKLMYTDSVRPVKLPPEMYEIPSTGTQLTAVGAGRHEEEDEADTRQPRENILFNVTVPIYDNRKCESAYRTINVKLTKMNFCAGYEKGRFDVCNGDSGGPLMDGDLQYGIVSFGMGCGRPGFPSVYTNVPRLVKWIDIHAIGTAFRLTSCMILIFHTAVIAIL